MIEIYFKAILDNSPESIVLIGKNHEVLAFNKTIREVLYQYHNREIKEGDFYYPDFVVEDSRKLYLEAYQSAINGTPFCVQHLTENDAISYWFEYKLQPVYYENELLGVTLSANNITKQKEAELEIIDLSKKFKAILDNTDESIILLDLNYKIMAINQIALRTVPHDSSQETLIGRDVRDFIPDKDNLFYDYYSRAVNRESTSVEIPYQNVTKDLIWYQTTFNPVYDENKQLIGVSVFAKDITEAKRKDNLISEQNTKLKDIAWQQSHIIRAPLARIMGIIYSLTNDDFEEEDRNYLYKAILDSSNELDNAIKNIVDKTKKPKPDEG
jgi:two-component system, sporulation sensor kinase E